MKKDIYVITNLITGTQYIGQSKDAVKRFRAHKAAKDNTLLHQAICYYGSDNFIMEILESQIEDFNEKEKFWIKEKNTLYPNGYNMTKGEKVSFNIAQKNISNINRGKVYSQEQIREVEYLLMNTNLSFRQIAKKIGAKNHGVISSINYGASKRYYNPKLKYPLRKPN